MLVLAAAFAGGVEGRETRLYWGDTHLHTRNSLDAYVFSNRTITPDFAYRFARGLPLIHPGTQARIRLRAPLDFMVVADHGEYLGVFPRLGDRDPLVADTETGKRYISMMEAGDLQEIYNELLMVFHMRKPYADLTSPEIVGAAWQENIDAAERHNDPGRFTTFIGWEWSSESGGVNLHRVVFTPQGGEVARQFSPYNIFDSDRPEDLWAWLEETGKRTGAEFIAIPHNPNLSLGRMFGVVDNDGRPMTAAYARTRARWESVVEVTQIKGDSETHPVLSPTDEFAAFERYEVPFSYGVEGEPQRTTFTNGDYARGALRRGLELEGRVGVNPYKFGMIGSTDSHTGLSTAEEDNFGGKMATDSTPKSRFADVIPGAIGFYMSAQGLAGVWAEENTRESLFAAFRRREVYATTGPRIALRLFAGYDFGGEDLADVAAIGYRRGVPMGGELTQAPTGKRLTFIVHAVKDPVGANLDRIQIVKGWVDSEGGSHETVYNVAASDGREILDNSLQPVGNTVDLSSGRYTNDIGDAELKVAWSDPEFDPEQRAFYYARALEIPTPRHSLYDAIALGIDPAQTGRPATIQERAYSSPIWYTP